MPTETTILLDNALFATQDNEAPMKYELAITRPSETTAGILEIETMLDKMAKDLVRFVEELRPPSRRAIKSVRLTSEGVLGLIFRSMAGFGPCIP